MDFPNQAAEFIYYRTYARWRDDLNRRETWEETVTRVINFLKEERTDKVPEKVYLKLKERMLSLDVLPSMRLVWAAGEAARRSNVTIYNCCALTVDSIESFAECLYILCCGTGVGFSVEMKFIDKLPIIDKFQHIPTIKYQIADDKEGWADSVKFLITTLYKGKLVEFDYSNIRPKGSRLKIMGGRASGPEPLVILHSFITDIFTKAQGRKLKPIECQDIMNKIAEVVVVAGVRRSSEVSLSDLEDIEIRDSKIWPFPAHRAMSNNSAVYITKPTAVEFLKEWTALAASGTGERGIFNREALQNNSPERRNKSLVLLSNPCLEIGLRDKQFCNLSTVIIKPTDDIESLLDKIETASWLGTIQSSFTKFTYLRKEWTKNSEEERLLGVSLSGQMDNPSLLTKDVLKALKQKAIKTNKHASKLLGINESTAITCVKPEGTTSQLCNSGSGVHPWYSRYYIRRYRISAGDPLFKMMKAQGIKFEPEVGQEKDTVNTWVVAFPIKAPKTAKLRENTTALEQLEWYKHIQTNYCEHSTSCTIYIKDHEWFDVGNWVYKHWNIVNGLSFLPYSGGKFKLAPYEEITKKQYAKMLKQFPKIDYTQLSKYELEDNTTGMQNLACTAGACEI